MNSTKKRFASLAVAAVMVSSFAAPIAAACNGNGPPPQKCNSGRGNGSEGCDPGKSSTSPTGSAGQNQGGDEGGPVQGGTGVA
jgi:hypothetical protein